MAKEAETSPQKTSLKKQHPFLNVFLAFSTLITTSCATISYRLNPYVSYDQDLPAATATPITQYTTPVVEKLTPNELGKIPVLEYHQIGYPEGRWMRQPDNFRKDLERMYNLGFRVINPDDYFGNRITTPLGLRPLMIAFDDSNITQFRYLNPMTIDPDSAIGVLMSFYQTHTDFGKGISFAILPDAAPPNNFFGQPEFTQRKVNFLLENGFKLANHTWWHMPLGQGTDREVQEQIVKGMLGIQAFAHQYPVNILVLPQGSYPQNPRLAVEGSFNGYSYYNNLVFLVGSDPAPAPDHESRNFARTPRVQAIESEFKRVFNNRTTGDFYVSDGSPDTLTILTGTENQLRPDLMYTRIPSRFPNSLSFKIR